VKENKYGEVLALIPARGGSKSIPRKNIAMVLGKPLIAWTIEPALASKHITRVIVTTDDKEIADISKQYGADVPFLRPVNISDDSALDIDFYRHALEWLNNNEQYVPDLVINLRPTSPTRRPSVIDKAIEIFAINTKADSLRSVHLATKTPYKMWLVGSNGLIHPVAQLPGVKEPFNMPRQKLPIVYSQDGYIDITRPSVIYKKNSTTGDLILPFILDEPTIDIDNYNDIKSAIEQLCLNNSPTPSFMDTEND
jgi:CMP-N,N'-diacetyllegionaminic acid synthase